MYSNLKNIIENAKGRITGSISFRISYSGQQRTILFPASILTTSSGYIYINSVFGTTDANSITVLGECYAYANSGTLTFQCSIKSDTDTFSKITSFNNNFTTVNIVYWNDTQLHS